MRVHEIGKRDIYNASYAYEAALQQDVVHLRTTAVPCSSWRYNIKSTSLRVFSHCGDFSVESRSHNEEWIKGEDDDLVSVIKRLTLSRWSISKFLAW